MSKCRHPGPYLGSGDPGLREPVSEIATAHQCRTRQEVHHCCWRPTYVNHLHTSFIRLRCAVNKTSAHGGMPKNPVTHAWDTVPISA